MDYLLRFMADSAVRPMLNTGSRRERLRQVANRAFIVIGTGMRQHRKKVREFVSFIRPESRYSVSEKDFGIDVGWASRTKYLLLLFK